MVYRSLAELSRVAELYPDLRDEHFASRFVLFHSRYSTNTTTAWRRAQPFWSLAHNGEIATIRGNVAWMHAIGPDLLRKLVDRHPSLSRVAARVRSIFTLTCGLLSCRSLVTSCSLLDRRAASMTFMVLNPSHPSQRGCASPRRHARK